MKWPYILLGLLCITIISVLTACNNARVKIISRYSNGNARQQLEFFDKNERSHFYGKLFYSDGKIQKEAEVKKMQYVGKNLTYFINGNISQVDRLREPCDASKDACDGELIRYNENGTISQRFAVKGGHF